METSKQDYQKVLEKIPIDPRYRYVEWDERINDYDEFAHANKLGKDVVWNELFWGFTDAAGYKPSEMNQKYYLCIYRRLVEKE